MRERELRLPGLRLQEQAEVAVSLSDPISVKATVKKVNFDEGECTLILKIPAADAVAAARFAIMHQIVFAAVFTPEDVEVKNKL